MYKKIVIFFLIILSANAYAADSAILSLNLGKDNDFVPAIKAVFFLTILTLAPAALLLMSAFTRILIVLSFLRQALGTPTMPPNQILIGLSLFLTYFVMSPTIDQVYEKAIMPYMEHQITMQEALEVGSKPLKSFMVQQTHESDLNLFYELAKLDPPQSWEEIPMKVVIPAFVTSELKVAFQMGFLVYLPFIVIDMVVSSVLMALGMMMLPPTVVSLPLKVIMFVIVDGWGMIVSSLVRSFN